MTTRRSPGTHDVPGSATVTTGANLLLAVDQGAATTSASLLGRIDGRWRLVGSAAAPADIPLEPALVDLIATVRATDQPLAEALLLPGSDDPVAIAGLPRLSATTRSSPRLAILAPTTRQLTALMAAADGSGWRTTALGGHSLDPLAVSRLVLDPATDGVLIGAADPPAADERRSLAEIVRLVAALHRRRPELIVLLAGGAATHASVLDGAAPALLPAAALPGQDARDRRRGGERDGEHRARGGARGRDPGAAEGRLPPTGLREAIRAHRPGGEDGRDAIARATASLSEALDRRIETIEIGLDGACRAVASPTGDGRGASRYALVAGAALVPPDPDDAVLKGIIEWSTTVRDRHRLRDRLQDLRRDPWGDASGDGALLRMAAARAAVARLVRATSELDGPAPDLVIASGGAWAIAPGPAVMLALADVLRRPGISGYAFDAARLLAPLGMIETETERRFLLRDLADDLLVPLGTTVVAGDLHRSRHPGTIVVDAVGGRTELELLIGGLQIVDLPPGELARARLAFHDPVELGARGRAFEVEVSGGLGGLLVDLRDVPLHLPDRGERRRELLASWQGALWAGMGSES